MEKEFIPYEQALALKELGFDLKINYYQHYSKFKKLSINKWEYAYLIRNERQKSKVYSSKEEAEFECLKELIEIVKINER